MNAANAADADADAAGPFLRRAVDDIGVAVARSFVASMPTSTNATGFHASTVLGLFFPIPWGSSNLVLLLDFYSSRN